MAGSCNSDYDERRPNSHPWTAFEGKVSFNGENGKGNISLLYVVLSPPAMLRTFKFGQDIRNKDTIVVQDRH